MADDTKAPTPTDSKAPTPAAPTPAAQPAAAQPAAPTPPADNGTAPLEKAAQDAQKAAAPAAGTASPVPAEGGAIPDHVPLPGAVVAERLTPEPGVGGARVAQHTQPIIGGVEGNIPKPVSAALVGLPFAKMGVRDSFEVAQGVTKEQLQAAADAYAKDHAGQKYEALPWLDGKVRVWRDA